jgi:hypothetical protein
MEIVSATAAYLVEYIFIPEVNQPPKRITSHGERVFTLDESVSWIDKSVSAVFMGCNCISC